MRAIEQGPLNHSPVGLHATRSPILNRLEIGDSVRSSERGERLAHRTHVAA